MTRRLSGLLLLSVLAAGAVMQAKPDFTHSAVRADPVVVEGNLVTLDIVLHNTGDEDPLSAEVLPERRSKRCSWI